MSRLRHASVEALLADWPGGWKSLASTPEEWMDDLERAHAEGRVEMALFGVGTCWRPSGWDQRAAEAEAMATHRRGTGL